MKNTHALSGLFLASMALSGVVQARVDFTQPFAPSEGMVAAVEKPFRDELCLNGSWQFQPVSVPGDWARDTGTPPDLSPPTVEKWERTAIKIPSPWNVNTWGNGRNAGYGTDRPYVADSLYYPSYPSSWDGVQMGWLKRMFKVPSGWTGKRIMIHFEAVAGEAQVLVNGKSAGAPHFDSFLPFSYDITDLVKAGGDNELLVGVRKSNLFDIVSPDYPAGQKRTYPNGSNTDNLVGIWNDVFLWALPAVRAEDVFVQPYVSRNTLVAEVTLHNDTDRPQTVTVGGSIAPWVNLAGKDVLSAPVPAWKLDAPVLAMPAQQATVPAHGETKVTLQVPVNGKLKLWSPDSPNLYGLTIGFNGQSRDVSDRKYTRFGWREFRIEGDRLTLNGKPIQLWGDFQHPFGPYVSSRRFVNGFYDFLKDMGANAVRPHANVMPRIWADLADERGLCVLTETSIFGSSICLNLKEQVTWERFDSHVDNLVLRDRNHPSVFGWSPGNEMFALFFKTGEDEKKIEYAKLKEFAVRPRALDPTRNWISVDGDQTLEGVMPVWSRHFGMGLPNDLPSIKEPLMIGEHGGTYYAGPPRTLKETNSQRGYESYAARVEILAYDLHRMITQVAQPKLAFFSPSELVWFGTEHLPLGYTSDTRPPGKEDGVFFPTYTEGTPGVQIERLPPYVMTINPGFDPSVPAYKPLAMFDAMKAALDPRGPQPTKWSAPPEIKTYPSHPKAGKPVASVGFVGSRDNPLYLGLSKLGVPLVIGEEAGKAALLVIDGDSLSDAEALTAKRLAALVLTRGGLVWVMARESGAGLPRLTELLRDGVAITARNATSLVASPLPIVAGFKPSDLYFIVESGDSVIQKAGLDGPLVASSKVLLTASNTDWSLFERQPEAAKCSSMLIYERLKKPAGASLIEAPRGMGRLWVSTLDASLATAPAQAFWTQLWRNLGVELHATTDQWLVSPGRDGESMWRYVTDTPSSTWITPGFNDADWTLASAPFGGNVPNGEAKTPWKTDDIYLRREVQLDKVPRSLTLIVHHDEDVEVYINGVLVFSEGFFLTNYKTVALPAKAVQVLKPGRNVIAVHCHQIEGGQFIDVGLRTTELLGAGKGHDLLLDGPIN